MSRAGDTSIECTELSKVHARMRRDSCCWLGGRRQARVQERESTNLQCTPLASAADPCSAYLKRAWESAPVRNAPQPVARQRASSATAHGRDCWWLAFASRWRRLVGRLGLRSQSASNLLTATRRRREILALSAETISLGLGARCRRQSALAQGHVRMRRFANWIGSANDILRSRLEPCLTRLSERDEPVHVAGFRFFCKQ